MIQFLNFGTNWLTGGANSAICSSSFDSHICRRQDSIVYVCEETTIIKKIKVRYMQKDINLQYLAFMYRTMESSDIIVKGMKDLSDI